MFKMDDVIVFVEIVKIEEKVVDVDVEMKEVFFVIEV